MESGKSYTLRVAINDEYDKVILVSMPLATNNRVGCRRRPYNTPLWCSTRKTELRNCL